MKNLKNDIVYTSKKTLDRGLNCGSEGNVSVRRKDTIFITPSGIETATLNETLISEVDINGNVKNNKIPSSEILMHLYIYRNRPEISSLFIVIQFGHRFYHVAEKKYLHFITWWLSLEEMT